MSALRQDRSINALAHFAPQKLALYKLITDQEAREKEKALCEGSLIEFFKHAWPHMGEPAELSINWHHEAVAEELEALAYGEIRNLIANIPFRHSKSSLVNVAFPAWLWTLPRDKRYPLTGAQVRFLCVSFAAHLAHRFGLKMLNLVQGYWYQSLWGDQVQIRKDRQARDDFANLRGGERISNSVEGGILGTGGDIIISDDPHNVIGAESDVQRSATLTAFSESLPSRVTDPRISAQVLIMQRLHHEDCTNWALDHWPKNSTVHLIFPGEFDPNHACPQDPRTHEGEILWPQVWNAEALARMRVQLGEYAYAGQVQQTPTPRTGGIIDARSWNVYPEEPPDPSAVRRGPHGQVLIDLPPLSYIVLALDTAMSERETADYNACTVWGVWHRRRNQIRNVVGTERPWFATRWSAAQDPDEARQQILEEDDQPRAILMEAWRRRCKLNDSTPDKFGKPQGLVQRVIDTARRRRVDKIIIEDKTRGIDVTNEIRRQMRGEEFQIELWNPTQHGDKVARLIACQPLFDNGLIYAPGNYEVVTDREGRQYCEVREEMIWVKDVIEEVATVPRGKHDDFADTTSMPLIWLRENGFLELTKQFIDNAVRDRMWRPKQQQVAEMYGV